MSVRDVCLFRGVFADERASLHEDCLPLHEVLAGARVGHGQQLTLVSACCLLLCSLLVAHPLLLSTPVPRRLLLPNSNGAHPLYGFRAGAWQLLCILGYIYDDCE